MAAPPPTPTIDRDVVADDRRPGLPRVLLITILLVLLAEAAVRVLEPALPPPSGWPDVATATKVAQLDRRAAEGCTDVVFVGNSMTRDDLVPRVFTDADDAGRTAYNAALDAASPALLERWVTDEVLPATDATTVVIGLSSFDVNDAAATPDAARRSYDDAPFTSSGAVAEVEAAFTRHLALVRNRESLRRPEVVWDAIRDRVRGRTAGRPSVDGIPGVLAPDGHGLSRRDLTFGGERSVVERMRRQFLEPFRIGGIQTAALRDLIDHIEDQGADAVLLVLPVTEEYVAAHPAGADDVADFRTTIERVASGTDAVVIDAPARPEREFADSQHLNGRGADALSAALPDLLRTAGVAARRCRPG